MNTRITKRVIEGFKLNPEKKYDLIWDTDVRGFAIRITQGKKSFVVERRVAGKTVRVPIGTYGAWTPETAREHAKALIRAMDNGQDPRIERARRKEEPTFNELCKYFMEMHASRKKTGNQYGEWLKWYCDEWAELRVSQITHKIVAERHRYIGSEAGKNAPYAANRWLATIKLIFNKAKLWEDFSPHINLNPAVGVERFPEKSRKRFATPEEMPALMSAIQQVKSQYGRAAVLLTLLTAARPSEIYAMRWDDLKLKGEEPTWNKPETKAGEDHLVPLSPEAAAVIRSLPKVRGIPFVLLDSEGTGPIKSPRGTWRQIVKKSKIKDLRHRDLRRTLASWLAAQGESLTLIGKLLDHKSTQTTAIYARLHLDPVRQALNKVTAQINQASKPSAA